MITERPLGSPETLARRIAAQLAGAIGARGEALIAVSGGRSPVPLFEALSGEALDWSRVTVTLVDERWVAPHHSDSNERLVCGTLLAGEAAAARFVGLWNGAPTAAAGQPNSEAAIRSLRLPFDVVLLGMGEDAHTASLFPGAPELAYALTTADLTAVVNPPAAPHERITLTLSALLRSRLLVLPLAGTAKLAVYRAALDDGAVQDMPIRALLRQGSVPLEVWLAE